MLRAAREEKNHCAMGATIATSKRVEWPPPPSCLLLLIRSGRDLARFGGGAGPCRRSMGAISIARAEDDFSFCTLAIASSLVRGGAADDKLVQQELSERRKARKRERREKGRVN